MNRPHILIVEDDLLIAKDISIILEKEGYETTIGCTTVAEAISKINEVVYKLVLIDINLGESSDGVSLGNYLLKRDVIPFIYITSNSDNVTLERVKDTRPHGIIIKPYKAIDIKSTVTIVLSNYKHKKIDAFRNTDVVVTDDTPFILKNVIQFINDNIASKIEVNELSAMTKWTHHHFIRVFTKFINKTPYQYILEKKIEKAILLICSSDLSLTIIAVDLGFSSYSNFCNAFKKTTKTTPEKYRKHHFIREQLK
jgi:AraC-like DNA-binding protein/CheY-like chemotaxis protein